MPNALVLIDKQQGWTSHDVVAKLRGILGTRKIGHAGTLDPMATGLLVLGVDAGTKLLQFISNSGKQYTATIRLGQSTVSDDSEGELVSDTDASGLSQEQIDAEIAKLTGEISQIPSSVSAIKVSGKRAYDLVREGQEVELKARKVVVSRFERLGEIRYRGELVDLDVIVDCSTGTYIRALARDLGAALGVGGHLTALRRTRIDGFEVSSAAAIDAEPVLLDLSESAARLFPKVELEENQARDVVHGRRIQISADALTAVFWHGQLLAVMEPRGEELKSIVVFPEVFNA